MNIDHLDILNNIPHRYPFVMVDKIISFHKEEKKLIGEKNLSFNEPYFQGHFPNDPVFPGVLMIESLAQLSVILLKRLEFQYKNFYLSKVDNFTIKTSALPGDVLILETTLIRNKLNFFVAESNLHKKINENEKKLVCKCIISSAGIN